MKTKQCDQKRGTLKTLLVMETKHYNQKQGTLKHYNQGNKTLQSKQRILKHYLLRKQNITIQNKEH